MPEGDPIASRSLEAGAETISFLEAGSGPTLLFLHSFGAGADIWRPQLLEFARDHHVIAPDLRGHGGSTWRTGLAPAAMALDAIGLAHRLGCQDLVVVGLSMGANVAIQMAAMESSLIRGLVLASAFTTPAQPLSDVLNGISREAELVIDMKDYARRRAERMLPGAGAGAEDFFIDASRMSKAALVTLGRSLARWNVTPLVRAVGAPCLLLRGEKDPYVTPETTEEIADRLRSAEVRTLPGAGHICNLDAPELFNRAAREFVARLERTRLSS
jgi:pimeloyl-ACP methyl ester carboxylesterase